MSKQIIVLDTNPSDGGAINVRCAMWFPVTAGKEWPLGSGAGSAFTSASAAEIQSIQQGQVVEEVKAYNFPSTTTVANIKVALVNSYTSRNAFLVTQPFKGQFYGVFFDSSNTWSA
jgi:hypothetical protein